MDDRDVRADRTQIGIGSPDEIHEIRVGKFLRLANQQTDGTQRMLLCRVGKSAFSMPLVNMPLVLQIGEDKAHCAAADLEPAAHLVLAGHVVDVLCC